MTRLCKRSWTPDERSLTLVFMRDPPKDWRIWVYADIDVSFESDFDDDIPEEDDKETEESKTKDRTRPWIIRVSRKGTVAVIVGPRHERIADAMRWAEDFAEDLDIAAGKMPLALGRTSGSA